MRGQGKWDLRNAAACSQSCRKNTRLMISGTYRSWHTVCANLVFKHGSYWSKLVVWTSRKKGRREDLGLAMFITREWDSMEIPWGFDKESLQASLCSSLVHEGILGGGCSPKQGFMLDSLWRQSLPDMRRERAGPQGAAGRRAGEQLVAVWKLAEASDTALCHEWNGTCWFGLPPLSCSPASLFLWFF